MSTFPFLNGQVLLSSAMPPQAVESMFQALAMQIFNIVVDPANPGLAYQQVTCGWQQRGQPAWTINQDNCTILAKPLNEPFSRVRDQLFGDNDDASLQQQMSFTQIWGVHFTFYGPNAYVRANAIVSAMSLDWVQDSLAARQPPATSAFYFVADYARPVYVPEKFQGQWWNRVDLDLKYNELVMESIITPSAESAEITITADNGATETIEVTA